MNSPGQRAGAGQPGELDDRPGRPPDPDQRHGLGTGRRQRAGRPRRRGAGAADPRPGDHRPAGQVRGLPHPRARGGVPEPGAAARDDRGYRREQDVVTLFSCVGHIQISAHGERTAQAIVDTMCHYLVGSGRLRRHGECVLVIPPENAETFVREGWTQGRHRRGRLPGHHPHGGGGQARRRIAERRDHGPARRRRHGRGRDDDGRHRGQPRPGPRRDRRRSGRRVHLRPAPVRRRFRRAGGHAGAPIRRR